MFDFLMGRDVQNPSIIPLAMVGEGAAAKWIPSQLTVRLYGLNLVDDVNKLIYSLINLYNHVFIHVMDSIYFMR